VCFVVWVYHEKNASTLQVYLSIDYEMIQDTRTVV